MKVEIDVSKHVGNTIKEDVVNVKMRGNSEIIEEILKLIKAKYTLIK